MQNRGFSRKGGVEFEFPARKKGREKAEMGDGWGGKQEPLVLLLWWLS